MKRNQQVNIIRRSVTCLFIFFLLNQVIQRLRIRFFWYWCITDIQFLVILRRTLWRENIQLIECSWTMPSRSRHRHSNFDNRASFRWISRACCTAYLLQWENCLCAGRDPEFISRIVVPGRETFAAKNTESTSARKSNSVAL